MPAGPRHRCPADPRPPRGRVRRTRRAGASQTPRGRRRSSRELPGLRVRAAQGAVPMLTGSRHSSELGATMQTEARAHVIDRLRGGDALALEELMNEFAPRVHRLAYGI